jgi:UDP-N-acetylmuramoyl-L-alanyl-D-glutamate--2,6-diaminopimelate ligase
MNYSFIKKIVILGIGGRGAYHITKFLHQLGITIEGYDLKESERTRELEDLGIKINYRNPLEGEEFESDIYIYSNDLPKSLQNRIRYDNADIEGIELGQFYNQIIKDYELNKLTKSEQFAFKESNLAPLFNIDTDKMKYIAITGTDGKTTTCFMIYHLLKEAGFKPAVITTVAAYIGDEEIDTGLHTTTPSSQELYELIKKVESENCTHLIIEATSHGLEQGRLAGLKFNSVGYTNITSEHLDYHGTWENYCNVKALLIKEHLKETGIAVLNKDDRSYQVLEKLTDRKITYSVLEDADYIGSDIEEDENKITFNLSKQNEKFPVSIPILGKYNISNLLCAVAIVEDEGINLEKVSEYISSFKTVRGRMEILKKEPYTVIVDYAHTSNATEKALTSARNLIKGSGKLIHVFGCAGHRDFYKRPDMGRISNELSDVTILTAEDSRQESLEDINDEIEKGWKMGHNKSGQLFRFDYMDKNVEVRRDAIKKALEIVKQGDVIIITGKAHENSLCFGQTEYPWNDIEEVKKLL